MTSRRIATAGVRSHLPNMSPSYRFASALTSAPSIREERATSTNTTIPATMNNSFFRTREQLIHAMDEGQTFKFLFFWGHQPSPDGTTTASCLSQWFASPFEAEGKRFPTAEHFMMAKKAELFEDQTLYSQILEAKDPGKAKALGRSVRNFDEATWQAHRWNIVVEANSRKFGQNPALRAFLVGTWPRILVEASPVDRIWGIGLEARRAEAVQPRQWQGLNLLGFALMEVRDAFRSNRL